MRYFYTVFSIILLIGGLSGGSIMAQSSNTGHYELVKTNDETGRLENIHIESTLFYSFDEGERIKFSIRNCDTIPCKKVYFGIYYKGKVIYRSQLPRLEKGDVYQCAANVKDKKDFGDLKFKISKKKVYRLYKYVDKAGGN